jgi:hypothetical protein
MVLGFVAGLVGSSLLSGKDHKGSGQGGERVMDAAIGKAGELQGILQDTPGLMEALESALGLVDRGEALADQASYAQAGASRSLLAQGRANQFRAGLLNTRPGAGSDLFLQAQEAGARAHLGVSQLSLATTQAGLEQALSATGQLNVSPLLGSVISGMSSMESSRLSANATKYAARKQQQSDMFGSVIGGAASVLGAIL